MKRREFSKPIRLQIIKRSLNERGQPCCEGCGLVLKPGQAEVDHKIAEALVIDKTKPLTAEDGQLLGPCCHRGEDGKTAKDVARIAKAKRQERGHLLPRKRSYWPCGKGSPFKKKINGQVERRS